MSDVDDLARRFFALWADYLAASAADPQWTEPLQQWFAAALEALPADGVGPGASRSSAGAEPAAGAPDGGAAALADLARRVDELTERLDALEGAKVGRTRTARRSARAASS